MSNFSGSENSNPTSTPRAGADPTIEELRAEYRAHRVRAELSPQSFRSKCRAHMLTWCIIPIGAKDSEIAPKDWVRAAKAVADDEEYERDCEAAGIDLDGYMGTGMSERAYYTAAGSAEFL